MNENYINYLKDHLNDTKEQWKEADTEIYGVNMQLDDMVFRKFANFFSSVVIANLIFFIKDPVLISLVAGGSIFKYLSKSKKLISKEDELTSRAEELFCERDRLEKIIMENSAEIAARYYNENKSNHLREDDDSMNQKEDFSLKLKK